MIRFNFDRYNFLILLSNIIRKIFRGDRIKRLSARIQYLLDKEFLNKNKKIVILDFGCGSMDLAKTLTKKIYIKKIVGTDTFDSNFQKGKLIYTKNSLLKNFKFDVILIIDVLHHIGTDNTVKILNQLSKLAKIIIIKDHFEYGYFSRQLLRFVDFYANYAYGVNIPKKYFTIKMWKNIILKSGLKETYSDYSFQQHDGLFNIILKKKHHFFSVVKKR